jgi:hypothetical protein
LRNVVLPAPRKPVIRYTWVMSDINASPPP